MNINVANLQQTEQLETPLFWLRQNFRFLIKRVLVGCGGGGGVGVCHYRTGTEQSFLHNQKVQ